MVSKDQHEWREKGKKINGDINAEEDEYTEEMHAHFLILSSLESNGGALKMMFGENKKEELHRV